MAGRTTRSDRQADVCRRPVPTQRLRSAMSREAAGTDFSEAPPPPEVTLRLRARQEVLAREDAFSGRCLPQAHVQAAVPAARGETLLAFLWQEGIRVPPALRSCLGAPSWHWRSAGTGIATARTRFRGARSNNLTTLREELELWMGRAQSCGLPEMGAFVTKMRQDVDAVVAGLTSTTARGRRRVTSTA